jgi:hypothetical protein
MRKLAYIDIYMHIIDPSRLQVDNRSPQGAVLIFFMPSRTGPYRTVSTIPITIES